MSGNGTLGRPAACACAALLVAVLAAAPTNAQAQISDVTGADYWYPLASGAAQDDEGAREVDLLTVTGAEGDTLYLNMTKDGRTIASHLGYPLAPTDGEVGDDGSFVGIVSLELTPSVDPSDPASTYAIEAYRDYEETELLYAGTVTAYRARLGDQELPLALRTLEEGEERAFDPPAALEYAGVTWKLTSETPADNVFTYEQGDLESSIEGTITYYDADTKAQLRQDTFVLEANAGPMTIPIDAIISADGSGEGGAATAFYRTMQLTNQVVAAYPGTTDFAVMCKRIEGSWEESAPFVAHIRYMSGPITLASDEGDLSDLLGNLVDRLIVTKETTYTPPTYISIQSGDVVEQYKLVADQEALQDGALVLRPGDAPAETPDDPYYEIQYELMTESSEAVWNIRLIDGETGATLAPDGGVGYTVATLDAEGRLLTAEGDYAGSVAEDGTFVAPTFDGRAVALVSDGTTVTKGDSYQLTRAEGSLVNELTVYYASSDYAPEKGYDATVNYVNAANGKTITSKTQHVGTEVLEKRAYLSIPTDERFTEGGQTYVRLNGQPSAINHHFFGSHTYTVYYRGANDDLTERTVIMRVRTVYDGTTAVRSSATATTATTTTTTGSSSGSSSRTTTVSGASGAPATKTTVTGGSGSDSDGGSGKATPTPVTTTTLTSNGGLTGVTTGGNTTLVRDDGTDLTSERITDDDNPLAAPSSTDDDATERDGADAAAATERTGIPAAAVAAVAAIAAAVASALFLFLKNRMGEVTSDAADGE